MKRVFGFGVVFMLYVLGFFLLLGSAWLKQNFEIESFEQILFHLRFPLLDTDSAIAWYFIKAVVLPSVSFAMLMSFAPSFVRFLRAHKEARLGLWLGFGASFVGFVLFVLVREPSFGDSSSVVLSFSKRVLLPSIAASFAMVYGLRAYRFLGSLGFRLSFGGVAQGVVACAVLIVGANVMNNKLHITSYIAKGTQEYGELYESHYAISSELVHSSRPQNLIIILAESLESTFSNGGGGESPSQAPFGEAIPRLSSLAQKHINFSPTHAIGGLVQVAGTGWTMAGTIAHLCGIPLTMPIGGNSFSNKYFLDSALCVSDVLANHGYTQAYLSGLDSSFAGMKYFLQSHAISVLDLPYFQQAGAIPSPLPQELQGFWGLKDSRLFALARDMLPTLKEPFALYVSTIDTHHPDGFVDPHACASVRSDYQGSFTCTDMLIAEFIDYVQSLYGDSVSIVVLGDHLSMKTGFFPPNVSRYVFDLFINPKFTAPYTLESTKSRTLSHFDIAPLLLDSVGIRTEAFGLGRNPLYKPTLLESTFSQEELNALIAQKSRMYDSFWDIGQKSYNLIKPKLEPSLINQTKTKERQ